MVFINSKTERSKIPQELSSASSEAGRGVPRIIVSTSDASRGLVGITDKKIKKDAREAARELRKQLKTVSFTSSPPEESDEGQQTLLAAEQTWTNQKGQEMTAAVVNLSGKTVIFLLSNGKEVRYEVAALSKESRERLGELRLE